MGCKVVQGKGKITEKWNSKPWRKLAKNVMTRIPEGGGKVSLYLTECRQNQGIKGSIMIRLGRGINLSQGQTGWPLEGKTEKKKVAWELKRTADTN